MRYRAHQRSRLIVRGAGVLGVACVAVALGLGGLVSATSDDPATSEAPSTTTETVAAPEPDPLPPPAPPEAPAVDPAPTPPEVAPPPAAPPAAPPDPQSPAAPPKPGPPASNPPAAAPAGPNPLVAAAAPAANPANVTICHRTNSVTNPYRQITVAESAVSDSTSNSDHLSHGGGVFDASTSYPPPHNGDQWGDIVPQFDANGNPRPAPAPTLNWSSGQAIFGNGCKVATPPSESGGLWVDKVVTGAGAPAEASFKVELSCQVDSGSPSTSTIDFTYKNDKVTPDGWHKDVPAGSTCTATEPDPGAAKVTFANNPVTIAGGKEETITVTNTFDEVTPPEPAKVTICHRTNSVTNPYEQMTVAESAVNDPTSNSDHLSHGGGVFDASTSYPPPHNGDQWGDIVPPFDANGNPRPAPAPTLNWSSGQAIFENGCKVVTPPDVGELWVTKVIGIGEKPAAGTSFEVKVECKTNSVVTTAETLSFTYPGDLGPKSVEVEYVHDESTFCTVDETKTGGAVDVTYAPAVAHGAGVELSEGNEEASATITNDFAVTPPDFGELWVTKVIGSGEKPDRGTSFEVKVECKTNSVVTTAETLSFTYPGDLGPKSVEVEYVHDESTFCTVDETKTGGAVDVTYAPRVAHGAGVELSEGNEEASATITNDFADGKVDGAGEPVPPAGVQVAGTSVTRVAGASAASAQLPYTGSTTDVLLRSALVLLGFGALITVPAWWQRRRRERTLTV